MKMAKRLSEEFQEVSEVSCESVYFTSSLFCQTLSTLHYSFLMQCPFVSILDLYHDHTWTAPAPFWLSHDLFTRQLPPGWTSTTCPCSISALAGSFSRGLLNFAYISLRLLSFCLFRCISLTYIFVSFCLHNQIFQYT